MQTNNIRCKVGSAALLFLVLAGLAAVACLCGGGVLALAGMAQLAGQTDALSTALQRPLMDLQALGRQFLQEQGYARSGLGLLVFHSGLWLVPVLASLLCMAVTGFAAWEMRAARRKRQELDDALIAWMCGTDFVPPPFCPETLQEAVKSHAARQAQDLRAARKQAEDAGRFAQNVYHQIKTPLAAARLLLEQIAASPQPGTAQTVDQCRAELDKIASLTHTLLQAGRFDAGAVALHWQPEDLELLAEETITELRPLCRARRVCIHLEAPNTADVQPVCCDGFWLGEALGNILKNCLEQTPPGHTILLHIEYTPAQTRIVVIDPGSLLPEGTDIFARYATTRAGGVGIGLHLARQIAEAHFGTLTAHNQSDGCVFCLTLPVLQGDAPYRQ